MNVLILNYRFSVWFRFLVLFLCINFSFLSYFYNSCSFFVTKERTKNKIEERKFCSLFNRKICILRWHNYCLRFHLGTNWRLSKKLNGSLSNKFGTCSSCGTRLLRKLKQYSANAASALLFKVFACFLKVAFLPNLYFGKFLVRQQWGQQFKSMLNIWHMLT